MDFLTTRFTVLAPLIVRQNVFINISIFMDILKTKPSQNKESAFNSQNHHSTLQN